MAAGSEQQLYQPLNIDDERPRIRLLAYDAFEEEEAKRWRLDTFLLDTLNLPEYVAMSYQWNPKMVASQKCGAITVNGELIEVHHNLSLMLKTLQALPQDGKLVQRRYWIDAVCINQNDLSERARQVTIMGAIFKSAQCVWVWLAQTINKECSTDAAVELACQTQLAIPTEGSSLSQFFGDFVTDKLKDPSAKIAWEGLITIAANSYWGRGWIVQEIRLGVEVLVLCGSKFVPAGALAFLFAVLLQIGNYLQEQGTAQMTRESLLLLNRFWVACGTASNVLNMRLNLDSTPLTLLQAVIRFHHHETGDPRDMIYAFLGLAADLQSEHKFVVDYRASEEQVFLHAATLMIQTSGRLEVLKFGAGSSSDGLPSWVPNFAKLRLSDSTNLGGEGYDCFALTATGVSEILSQSWDESTKSFILDNISAQPVSFPTETILSTTAIPITSSLHLMLENPPTVPQLVFVNQYLKSSMDIFITSIMNSLHIDITQASKQACFAQYASKIESLFAQISDDGGTAIAEFIKHDEQSRSNPQTEPEGSEQRPPHSQPKPFSPQHRYIRVNLPRPFSLAENFRRVMQGEKCMESSGVLDGEDWKRMEELEEFPTMAMCRGYVNIQEGDTLTVIPGCSLPLILRPVEEEPSPANEGAPRRMRVISEAFVYGLKDSASLAQMPREEIQLV